MRLLEARVVQMRIKKCWSCGHGLDNNDMICMNCNAEQLQTNGMFGWSCLGFLGGCLIPFLAGVLISLLITDKHVAQNFLNPTIQGRSRWCAARKGMIVGLITKFVLSVLLIVGFVYSLYWISSGFGC